MTESEMVTFSKSAVLNQKPKTVAEFLQNQQSLQVLAALASEYNRIPLLWRFTGFFHAFAIFALLAYFNDEKPLDPKQVHHDAEADTEDDLSLNVPHGKDAFGKFFNAAKKVNPLFIVPPFIFLCILVALDQTSKALLKSRLAFSLWKHSYATIANNLDDSRWIRDFTLDVRPLLLTWSCLLPPVGILLILLNTGHTIYKSICSRSNNISHNGLKNSAEECLVLRQQIDTKRQRPREFYNSTWFNPAVTLPYVLAIPASISLCIYFNLGVDALLGYPSANPKFHTVIVIICLYIYGLSTCLSILFMRSYFTFCWNFMSPEYDLEVYDDRIKKLPIKGWFLDFLKLFGREPTSQILWKDVVSINFSSSALPIDNTKRDIEAMVLLRKLAYFYESLAKKMEIHTDCLEIKNSNGRIIEIRLWEISAQDKLKLFEAIRRNCPSIYLDEKVQEALVGSSIMREPQYTQIWFQVLANSTGEEAQGQLQANHILKQGKYTISSGLASGGQAVLYNAKDLEQRAVVLKEFQLTPGESFGAKIESAKDFENESAILSQLSHEGIVKMLDMFYENGRVYIVLEHVEGRTLRQLVAEQGRLEESTILQLCQQMCSILQYLHKQQPPIVHRDFTPDNLIVQPDGKLKLIDFSVAERKRKKLVDCAGKHAYTPPEQFAGEACPQSDIYALGATLYFLATANDPVPISTSVIQDNLYNETLSPLIQKCTQLSLLDRYESIEWILNDIPTKESATDTERGDENIENNVT